MNLFKWRKVLFIGKDVSTVRIALIEQFHQLKNIESEIDALKRIAVEAEKQPESSAVYTHYLHSSNTLVSHILFSNSYCTVTRLSPISVPFKIDSKNIAAIKKKVHSQLNNCESNLAALR